VLGLGGAAAGLLLAGIGMEALEALIPEDLVNVAALGVNARILGFTIAVSLASTVIFGSVPALHASRAELNLALKQSGRSSTEPSTRLRRGFVVAQVALALLLLSGAGLLIRTLANLRSLDLGFPSDHLLTVATPLSPKVYGTDPKILSYADRTIEAVAKLPGGRSAAFVSNVPFSSIGSTVGFRIEGAGAFPDGSVQRRPQPRGQCRLSADAGRTPAFRPSDGRP